MTKRFSTTTLMIAAGAATFAAVGLGWTATTVATAQPNLNPPASFGPEQAYTLTCWQHGQRIVRDTGLGALETFTAQNGDLVRLSGQTGPERTLLSFDETFCVVELGE